MDLSFFWPIATAFAALVGAVLFLGLFMRWRRSSLSAELFARSRSEWRRAQEQNGTPGENARRA